MWYFRLAYFAKLTFPALAFIFLSDVFVFSFILTWYVYLLSKYYMPKVQYCHYSVPWYLTLHYAIISFSTFCVVSKVTLAQSFAGIHETPPKIISPKFRQCKNAIRWKTSEEECKLKRMEAIRLLTCTLEFVIMNWKSLFWLYISVLFSCIFFNCSIQWDKIVVVCTTFLQITQIVIY